MRLRVRFAGEGAAVKIERHGVNALGGVGPLRGKRHVSAGSQAGGDLLTAAPFGKDLAVRRRKGTLRRTEVGIGRCG